MYGDEDKNQAVYQMDYTPKLGTENKFDPNTNSKLVDEDVDLDGEE